MSSDMPKETRGFPLSSSRTPDGSNDQSTMQQSLLNGNLPQPPTHGGGQLVPANFTGVPALSPFGFPQNQGNMLHPSQVALSMMAAAANPVALGGNNNHMMLPPGVSPAPPGSPTFFHGWKLRSGKWLQEEESYADLLIDMFDQGHLSDCMTGSTLRAYLAQKLHCAPMRISKKFAGKGIGKKVYSSRVETRKVIPANVMEQRRKRQQAVEDAEKKFHEAVTCDAPENNRVPPMGLVPGFMPFISPAQSLALQSMAAAQQYFLQLQQQQQQHQQNGFYNTNQSSSALANQQSHTLAPAANAVAPAAASSVQQLQESFAKALASQSSQPSNMQQSNAASVQVENATRSLVVQPSGDTKAGLAVSSHGSFGATKPLGQTNNTGLQHQVGGMSTIFIQSPQTGVPVRTEEESTVEPPDITGVMNQHSFPDFLAGFDKVALSMKSSASGTQVSEEQQQSQLQCSPPFTSRSFDDFHRLLGKDLSPLDEESSKAGSQEKKSPQTASDSSKKKFDTTALFTAESYAMFAQESARAASQHAAYLNHAALNPSAPSQRSHRIGSFDFDSTMKLVSQHVPVAPMNNNPIQVSTTGETKTAPVFSSLNSKEMGGIRQTRLKEPPISRRTRNEINIPVVSGSEPASSAAESSVRGSTSESNGSDNTFSNSEDGGQFESGEDSHSSDDLSYEDSADADSKRQSDNDKKLSGKKRRLSVEHNREKKTCVHVNETR